MPTSPVFNLLMIMQPPPTPLRLVKLKNESWQHQPIKYTNLHGGTYSLRKVLNTFPIFFLKKIFSKFFWALFRCPWGYCPPFSNSPSPATYPHIFSQLSTFCCTSFFKVPATIYFLV